MSVFFAFSLYFLRILEAQIWGISAFFLHVQSKDASHDHQKRGAIAWFDDGNAVEAVSQNSTSVDIFGSMRFSSSFFV